MKNFKSITNTTIVYCVILVSIFLYGCEEGEITTTTTPKGGEVRTKNGIFIQVNELNEFEYKGHIYISCNIKDGMALTHAGHCWCNSIKK